MSLRKPIFISEQGYSQEMDGYADSVQLSAIQIIDADGNQKVALDGYSGNLAVAGEATLASAVVSDLTQSRVVFAGADGALVDDAALTFASNQLTVGASDAAGSVTIKNASGDAFLQAGSGELVMRDNNADPFLMANSVFKTFDLKNVAGDSTFHVAATSGDTEVAGTLSVAGEATLASAIVSDLTQSRVVFAGADGALVDDSRLTFDGYYGSLNLDGEATLASAIVSDLTQSRVVFAGADGALVDDAALTFASNALTVGASDAAGTVSVRNQSDATVAQITCDASTASLAMFSPDGANMRAILETWDGAGALKLYGDTNYQRVVFDGSLGYGLLGGAGANGQLYLRQAGGTDAIILQSETATATIGGPVAGTVSVKDASDVEVIRLDGYAGNGNFAGMLDVGALALNANGDAFIQNLQMPAVGDGYDAVNRAYVDGYVSDLLLQINAASDSSFSDFTAAESLALGNPVFIDTSSKAAKADADFEAKSWVIGVAKAAASADAAVEIIRDGVCAGALTGLSFAAADQIWLAPSGGLANAKPTASGARLILVGFAKSADDLFVDIRDYGRNV